MDFQRARAGAALLLGLLSATMLTGVASAQPSSQPAAPTDGTASPWDQGTNPAAVQADAWFDNYKFGDGQTLARVKIPYSTLGVPHRNSKGEIDNAVLVLHWTGADSRALLSPTYTKALFDPGRPLDAHRYYLIFPDSVGHGRSSKPSDGLKAKFPRYDYNDIVDLQHKVVAETLGIKHLHAILGMSMGGMNAWQWAEAYPDEMDGVMPVVSLPIKVSGRNAIWRHLAIDMIKDDPGYQDGNYTAPLPGWARAYALLRMMIDGVAHLQTVAPNGDGAETFVSQIAAQSRGIDPNDVLYSLKSS